MERLPSGIPQRLVRNVQPNSVDKSIVRGYMTYPRIVYQYVRCFAKSKTLKGKPDATICQTTAIAISESGTYVSMGSVSFSPPKLADQRL